MPVICIHCDNLATIARVENLYTMVNRDVYIDSYSQIDNIN